MLPPSSVRQHLPPPSFDDDLLFPPFFVSRRFNPVQAKVFVDRLFPPPDPKSLIVPLVAVFGLATFKPRNVTEAKRVSDLRMPPPERIADNVYINK